MSPSSVPLSGDLVKFVIGDVPHDSISVILVQFGAARAKPAEDFVLCAVFCLLSEVTLFCSVSDAENDKLTVFAQAPPSMRPGRFVVTIMADGDTLLTIGDDEPPVFVIHCSLLAFCSFSTSTLSPRSLVI